MIQAWLIALLFFGGLLSWLAGLKSAIWSRRIALTCVSIGLLLVVGLAASLPEASVTLTAPQTSPTWLVEWRRSWIPTFGIQLHLAMDGLSLVLVALTFVLGIVSVAVSWKEVGEQVGLFHFFLLWTLAAVSGVFMAMDLILFFFFWEMMLIPMYFLIAIWGHERRTQAAAKFFVFTQASGLLLLLGILGLHFFHARATGLSTFDYEDLLHHAPGGVVGMLCMLGFLIAFVVKLPAVPFHTWLPDAHTEAPTAGSIALAGLLLKTGGYGIIRFVLPIFPEAAVAIRPLALTLGAVSIIYGAVLAFAQSDLKRMVAYTSVSHLGFVLVGAFAWNVAALQGAVMQMLCHGLSTGALFAVVGIIQERYGTRDLSRLGGLWTDLPRLSAAGLFFAMAALGLPGLGNFVGEFLVLVGVYEQHPFVAVAAAFGLLAATVYAVTLVQRAFHGVTLASLKKLDLSMRELTILGVMAALLIWLGIFPHTVFVTAGPALATLLGQGGGL
jgi:NADH-quinone oxidoreductase subunit M